MICIAVCLVALDCRNSYGIFIDFRGLASPVRSVSAGGIIIQFSGNLHTSTATRFGIDGSGPNDVPDQIDGGNGVAESVGLLFNRDVFVDSIVVSEFGATDAGRLSTKTGPSATLQNNGVNETGGLFARGGSAHGIYWTGLNAPGEGRGFSLDGLDVRLVNPDTADFNGSGAIDGHDFLIWQRNFGKDSTLATGDANEDRRTNGWDFFIWRNQYGSAASLQASALPEPSGNALILMATIQAFATGTLLRNFRFICR